MIKPVEELMLKPVGRPEALYSEACVASTWNSSALLTAEVCVAGFETVGAAAVVLKVSSLPFDVPPRFVAVVWNL